MILNRAKGYYENDKERLRGKARDKYRTLSEEAKIKRDNTEKTDIAICLKKKKQRLKEYQKKLSRDKKGLNIIMNKIMF